MEEEIIEYNILKKEMLKNFGKSIFKYGTDVFLCVLLLSFCMFYFLFGAEGLRTVNDIKPYHIDDLYCCDTLFYAIHIFLLMQLGVFKRLGLKGSTLVTVLSALLLIIWLQELYLVNCIYSKSDELVVYLFRSGIFRGLWTVLISLLVQAVLFLPLFKKLKK